MAVVAKLIKSMEAWVDDEIESSSRVQDLLVGRLEKDQDTGKLVKKPLDFRHYLRIKQPEQRKALTRFILSSHNLAVERRRWKERGNRLSQNNGAYADFATYIWKTPLTLYSDAHMRSSKSCAENSSKKSVQK
jgi:hypothetical protein